MQPHSEEFKDPPYGKLLLANQEQTFTIGNTLLRRLRQVSIIGIVALDLAVANNVAGGEITEYVNQPISEQTLSPVNPSNPPNLISQKASTDYENNRCTYIGDFPEGYYLGLVCDIKGNVIYPIDTTKSKKYKYGVIVDDGIYKCGWIETGVIKTIHNLKKSNIKDIKYCKKIEDSLKHPSTHFKVLDCSPGSCQDGKKIDITDECDHSFWANFASSYKSAFNLHPKNTSDTSNSGFSMYLGKQYDNALWRGDLTLTSKDGFASDVRSKSIGMWGFLSKWCTNTSQHPDTTIVLSH